MTDADLRARRERAEQLWEELGGQLCICQREDVWHWCENCQRKIGLIMDALLREAEPQGSWPADDIRRAFVEGAKWWEFTSTKGTMWGSDRNVAEAEAERRYPGGVREAEPTPEISAVALSCPKCGHEHSGRQLAYICIGCPCDWRPADGVREAEPKERP